MKDPAPFRIGISDAEIDDLHARLDRTRFPAPAPGEADWEYGTELAWLRDAVDHWRHRFDWRAQEAVLNGFDQFTTELGGEHIHFVHQRSPHPDAMPIVISHGWPGSVSEFVDIIGPLVDPPASGGDAADAFHVVCPSLPGFGFSGPTRQRGVGPQRTAEMWAELMAGLGYDRYVAQGGDWGAMITTNLGRTDPEHVAGIHLNMPVARPDRDTMQSLRPDEEQFLVDSKRYQDVDSGYFKQQSTKPQTVGYGLDDSPAGLLAWIGEKFRTWTDNDDGPPDAAIGMDALLRNVSIYWFTGTGHSSARMYYEHTHSTRSWDRVDVPTAVALFPGEISRPSRRWCEPYYELTRWTEFGRGGHFAAMEVPDLLVGDIRAFARTLRG